MCKQEDRGNCTQSDKGATDITPPGSPVLSSGVTVNLIVGAGVVFGAGTWMSPTANGEYVKFGVGVGFDVSAGVDAGYAESEGAFSGAGEAICGGTGPANACVGGIAGDPKLRTGSVGVAGGPSEIMPASGHTERTQTVTSRRPNVEGPNIPRIQACAVGYCPPR